MAKIDSALESPRLISLEEAERMAASAAQRAVEGVRAENRREIDALYQKIQTKDAVFTEVPIVRIDEEKLRLFWATPQPKTHRYRVVKNRDIGVQHSCYTRMIVADQMDNRPFSNGARTPSVIIKFEPPTHGIGADLDGFLVLFADYSAHHEVSRRAEDYEKYGLFELRGEDGNLRTWEASYTLDDIFHAEGRHFPLENNRKPINGERFPEFMVAEQFQLWTRLKYETRLVTERIGRNAQKALESGDYGAIKTGRAFSDLVAV